MTLRIRIVHARVRRFARRCSRRATVGMQMLLALSLWHAPIPWVHAHELQGPQVENSPALHEHVDHFHSHDVAKGETHLDLHTHLILPWDCDRDSDGSPHPAERPGCRDDDFVPLAGSAGSSLKAIGQPTIRALGDLAFAGSLPAMPRPEGGDEPVFSLTRGRHFFETFGSSVSVRDLICVRLC
ncbi:MAG: hypothetical protein EXS05_09155 [Planctomycetaceae bacterium]|nr:hypothetical protein [Planctomycetaceae bacterium]